MILSLAMKGLHSDCAAIDVFPDRSSAGEAQSVKRAAAGEEEQGVLHNRSGQDRSIGSKGPFCRAAAGVDGIEQAIGRAGVDHALIGKRG